MSETVALRRFLVSGRVQGVFFRESTRQQAEKLGLTGHALNLADGRVEVLACGPPARVQALERWLWQGPPMARVKEVISEEPGDLEAPTGFITGRG